MMSAGQGQGMYREGGAQAGGLPLPRARLVPLTIAIGVAAFLAIAMSILLFGGIGHGPTGAWMLFRNGGWPMYLILLADLVAPILIAVLGAFVVRGKRLPAGVLFAIAAIPFALALFGAWVGQTLVVGAISGESVDPEQKARILAEGFAEGMSNDIFGGLVACGAAIVACLAAASAAASIDIRLAARGERASTFGAKGAGAAGAVWFLATLVVGGLRVKSAGPFVLLPALPLVVIVPFAVLAARGASVVRGWHDRAEGTRVAGAVLVAAVSALLAVLALQRGIEASFTSQALSAISGESIDPSQRLRILAYAVDAGRLAPISYAVHAVLGTATFGLALAPAIGGGKHPATPSAIVAVAIGVFLLGGAFAMSRTRESVPKKFAEAARTSNPGGVDLPEMVEALSDKRSGGGYGTRVVVTKDGGGEASSLPTSSYPSEATRFTIYADKAATLAMVRAKLPSDARNKVTFVTEREHPPELVARVGYLASYLGRVGYVSGIVEDDAPNATAETLRVVSIADDAVEIDGSRYAFPLPTKPETVNIGAMRKKRIVQYVLRASDTVERAVKIIVGVEKLREMEIVSWDFDRTIVVDDPSRPKKPQEGGLGLGGGGFGFGGLVTGNAAPSTKAPSIRFGTLSVNGRLPPEVVQRIVRQNFGRFRLCYENGLRLDPKLTGRVTVKVVIGRTGEVSTAQDGGSDLPDKAVAACVVRAMTNLSFPQPEGGIVTAVIPLDFTPAK